MGASGSTLVDFGAFPGSSNTTVAITGQGGILSTSLVEAWILPATTADHTADEHTVETLSIFAGNIVAGTGFTIYMANTSQTNENPADQMAEGNEPGYYGQAQRGRGTLIYGKWNVAWVWN